MRDSRGVTLPQLVGIIAVSLVVLGTVVLTSHHVRHGDKHQKGPPPAVSLLILLGVGGFIGVRAWTAAWRARSLETLASQSGAQIEESAQGPPISGDAKSLDLFRLGIRPKTRNILRFPAQEPELVCFDYSYVLRDEFGPNPETFAHEDNRLEQTVVALRWPAPRWPVFRLSTRALLGEPVSSMTLITVNDLPDYQVWGEDEAAVRELLTRDVVAFLTHDKGVTVEARGDSLIVYRPCQDTKTDALVAFSESAKSLAALLGAGSSFHPTE